MATYTVRVGAHDIQVVEAGISDLRSDSTVGRADIVNNRITIPEEAAPSRKLEIVFHESLHIAMAGHAGAFQHGMPEETAVCLCGEAIVSLIRDNPGLIRSALAVFGHTDSGGNNGRTKRKTRKRRKTGK